MKTSDKKEDKNGWKKHEPKKDEEKKTFFPIIDGQNPRYPYTQVKEILYEYMRWSGKYKHNLSLILEMLEEEKEIDPDTKIPKQKVSTKLDKDKAAAENIQFEIKWKIELKRHYEKISHLEDEQHTFCADIMKMCHDKMTEKIRKEPDYTTLKLKPLELLARIKKKMTQTDKTEHEFSNLWDTIERLVMCKMRKKDGKKDSLHAYKERMTGAIAGLKSILGEEAFHEFAKKTERYQRCTTQAERKKCQSESFEAFTSIAILKNLDQREYGGILEKFNQEYGLTHLTYEQRDKFPRTNEDAISIAMKHTVTKVPQDTRRNLNETEKNSTNAGSESGGGNADTTRGQDQSNGNVSHAQRQSGSRCDCCGQPGHQHQDCRFKDVIARDEWASTKRRDRPKDQTHHQIDPDKAAWADMSKWSL